MNPTLTLPELSGHTFSGILLIGDPHLASRRPGRRLDADFGETVMGKLRQADAIAKQRNLYPVFLGDLLHIPHEDDLRTLTRLIQFLGAMNARPVCVGGNHDKSETELGESDALTLLDACGVITPLDRNGLAGTIRISDGEQTMTVAIGATPYAADTPRSVAQTHPELQAAVSGRMTDRQAHDAILKATGADRILWLTHDNFAFGGEYPNSKPVQDIVGADWRVNGHMHGTTAPIAGTLTAHYNPGNITRMRADRDDYLPAVWELNPFETATTPAQGGGQVMALKRHLLDVAPGNSIFDREGLHSRKAGSGVVSERISAFADELLAQRSQSSEDATFAREMLDSVLTDMKAGDMVQARVRALLGQSLGE